MQISDVNRVELHKRYPDLHGAFLDSLGGVGNKDNMEVDKIESGSHGREPRACQAHQGKPDNEPDPNREGYRMGWPEDQTQGLNMRRWPASLSVSTSTF